MRGSEEIIKFQTTLEPPNVRAVASKCTNSTIFFEWEPIRGAEFYKVIIPEIDEEIVVQNEFAEVSELPPATNFKVEVVAVPFMTSSIRVKMI